MSVSAFEESGAAVMETVIVGAESVGKSALAAALSDRFPTSANYRGTTIACERYRAKDRVYIDTPGLLFEDESAASGEARSRVASARSALVVISAVEAGSQLRFVLPLAAGRPCAVVVTFWDKVAGMPGAEAARLRLQEQLGVPVIPCDARKPGADALSAIRSALARDTVLSVPSHVPDPGWSVPCARGPLDLPVLGPLLALALQFVPAWIAVTQANAFADAHFDRVKGLFAPVLARVNEWPAPLADVFGGEYGFVAMFPFLMLCALPTVLAFAILLALYKTSGLIDRLTVALHPLLRPFGLTGRDLVRIMMGFGCNVPAVINSRACSASSRGTCVSAISFGSACSYQVPATLAVLAAAGYSGLALPFLLWLGGTTLLYLRFTVPRELREANARLTLRGRDYLQWPSSRALVREVWGVLSQFVGLALPVFIMICGIAGLLAWTGALKFLARALAPVMAVFNLPAETAVSVLLGSIRKDGLAIGLLDAEWASLRVPLATPFQVLTAVYLAGVLLPCVVTMLAMAREMGWTFALRTAGRQALFAALFSFGLAWGGAAWIASSK
jgi:Fe2+ transport system protein B